MDLKAHRGKIVTVVKKSRGRFPIEVGIPGTRGMVITTWYSSMGTGKLTILKSDGSTCCTTLSCVSVDNEQDLPDKEKALWQLVKKDYDDSNAIPVIVVCLNAGKKAYRLK